MDCTYDKEVEDALRKSDEQGLNNIEQTKSFLNDFFHLFFSSGRLGRQWEHKIIQPRFSGIAQNRFNYPETIKTLKNRGVLVVTKEKGQTKMAISDNHKEDVVKFTKDGTISLLVSDLITDLVGSKN